MITAIDSICLSLEVDIIQLSVNLVEFEVMLHVIAGPGFRARSEQSEEKNQTDCLQNVDSPTEISKRFAWQVRNDFYRIGSSRAVRKA